MDERRSFLSGQPSRISASWAVLVTGQTLRVCCPSWFAGLLPLLGLRTPDRQAGFYVQLCTINPFHCFVWLETLFVCVQCMPRACSCFRWVFGRGSFGSQPALFFALQHNGQECTLHVWSQGQEHMLILLHVVFVSG